MPLVHHYDQKWYFSAHWLAFVGVACNNLRYCCKYCYPCYSNAKQGSLLAVLQKHLITMSNCCFSGTNYEQTALKVLKQIFFSCTIPTPIALPLKFNLDTLTWVAASLKDLIDTKSYWMEMEPSQLTSFSRILCKPMLKDHTYSFSKYHPSLRSCLRTIVEKIKSINLLLHFY